MDLLAKGTSAPLAESKLLREFASALQTTMAGTADLSDEAKGELKSMVDWTLRNANYVDPLTDLKWTVGQFKPPTWFHPNVKRSRSQTARRQPEALYQ